MSDAFRSHTSYRIDQIADRFEAAWQQGANPQIASFLNEIEAPLQRSLLLELVRIDFEYKLKISPSPSIDDYLQKYPELSDSDSRTNELVTDLRQVQQRVEQGNIYPEPSPEANRRFVGRFRLLERIGAGTFGTVYSAEDPELRRQVAIKIPRSTVFATEHERQRFIQEARSAAGLKHPGIVQVHEIGHEAELPFIVTDFICGWSLAEEMRRRRFSPTEAAELLLQIADALQCAHLHGIIHRDVTPSNILIDHSAHPFVTDFGLAHIQSTDAAMTMDGQILGTPAYMSPEQAAGDSASVDARSDVYGLGVILYELLTGERPFRGDTGMVLHQVRHVEPLSPRILANQVPADLETICNRAMAKNPSQRYATAGDVRDDLQRFLDDKPIVARPIGILERSGLWAKRNPAAAGLSITVVLLLLLTAVVATVMSVQLANAQTKLLAQLSRTQAEAGILEIERGSGLGLLRLLQAVETAHDNPIERSSRVALLAGWHRDLVDRLDVVVGHQTPIQAAIFSPDGSMIVTAAQDGSVRIWNSDSGKLLKTISEDGNVHNTLMWNLQFTADGSKLLTSSSVNTKVWNTKSWRESFHTPSRFGAISPDGRVLAAVGRADNEVRIFDLASDGILSGPFKAERLRDVRFSPNGKLLAAFTELGTISIFDVDTGRRVGEELTHTERVRVEAGQFSPDGRLLASGGWDHTVRLWNTVTGTAVGAPLQHDEDVKELKFSKDGLLLATASFDGFVRIWNTKTLRPVGNALPHSCPVLCIATTKNGQVVASGCINGTVTIWDTGTGQPIDHLAAHQGRVQDIAFNSDGSKLLTAGTDASARVWNIRSPAQTATILPHAGRVWETDISHDNKWVAGVTENGFVHIWNLQKNIPCGKPIFLKSTNDPEADEVAEVLSCCFHPSEPVVVSATSSGRIMFWRVSDSGATLITEKTYHPGAVRRVTFGPDGNMVAVASNNNSAGVWKDWRSENPLELIALERPIWAVDFSANGRLLATGDEDGIVRVFRSNDLSQIARLRHRGQITSIAFSPDKSFVVVSTDDHSVRQWQCDSWQPFDVTIRSRTDIEYVTVSPDSRLIATAANGGVAQVWDALTGLPCGLPNQHKMFGTAVRFSRDGQLLLSSSFDRTVIVRNVASRLPANTTSTSLKRELSKTLGAQLDSTGEVRTVPWRDWQAIP